VLRSLIRILRASLVQIDTEMTKKYCNQRYAVDAVSTNTHMSNTAISYSSRNAFLPIPPAFDAPVRGVPSEYRHPLWYGKTRMVWLPDGEKISKIFLFVLTQLTNVTDGRTDRHRMPT